MRVLDLNVFTALIMSATVLPLPCSSQLKLFSFLEKSTKNAVQILSLHIMLFSRHHSHTVCCSFLLDKGLFFAFLANCLCLCCCFFSVLIDLLIMNMKPSITSFTFYIYSCSYFSSWIELLLYTFVVVTILSVALPMEMSTKYVLVSSSVSGVYDM